MSAAGRSPQEVRAVLQRQALAPSIAAALAIAVTTPNETHVGVFADRKPKAEHIRHQGARERARRLKAQHGPS